MEYSRDALNGIHHRAPEMRRNFDHEADRETCDLKADRSDSD